MRDGISFYVKLVHFHTIGKGFWNCLQAIVPMSNQKFNLITSDVLYIEQYGSFDYFKLLKFSSFSLLLFLFLEALF